MAHTTLDIPSVHPRAMLQKLVGELSMKRNGLSLAPSSVHFLLFEPLDCPPLTELPCLHHLPRLQVVHKDNAWFALNSAQLHLYRTLEQAGKCSKVLVDVVSLQRVPPKLRNLMIVKPNPTPLDRQNTDSITDMCHPNIQTAVEDEPCTFEDKHGLTEQKHHIDCSADTEVAAGVQTARGYHALVQRDPHDDVTSEQSTDTTDGTSEESESDCHSVHSDSASELGFSGWSDENVGVSEGESDDEDCSSDYSDSDSNVSRERLEENDCLL